MKPKNILQRVLDYALSELERRARAPEAAERREEGALSSEFIDAHDDDARAEVTPRDAARDSDELEGAPASSAEVDDAPSQSAARASAVSGEARVRTRRSAAASSKAPSREIGREAAREVGPVVRGLEALRGHGGEGMTLRWSLQASEVARARRLVSGKPVLCLRIVSFSREREEVRREVQDRPGVDLAGECQVAESPERAVVALGLRAGERFISIAHHVL